MLNSHDEKTVSVRKESRARLRAYLLTLIFTLAIAILLIWKLGMYPFGDHHLCYSDADQYYGFYGYLMSTFFSENNLTYSWSMALGNGMLSTYAYYAASPLNLLLVFFGSNLMLGTQVIAFVRLFFISLSFCALLNYCDAGHVLEKGVLSASYAFIGYAVFYAWNASWLDGIAFLPLLILGLKKLLNGRGKLLYVVILALAIISNFYIGYMLCGASVVFYLMYCLNVKSDRIFSLQRLKKTFLLYAGSSLLGAGLSMGLVLPAYVGIPKERKAELVKLRHLFSPHFGPTEFFSMFFSGSATPEDYADNLPVIFVGILPFVLVLLYFLNKKIRKCEKTKVAALLLLFIISFEIPLINTAWHGFSINHWFNYRYSFLFSFVLLLIAYRSLTNLPEKRRTLFLAEGLFLLIAVLVFFVGRTGKIRFDKTLLAGDIICSLAGTALLCVAWYGRKALYRNVLRVVLCLLIILNVSNNAIVVMREGTEPQSVSEVLAQQEKLEKAKQYCEKGKITRIGRCGPWGRCEASQFAYASVADYASTENRTTLRALKRLGLAHDLVWSDYTRHAPQSTDDLLGIRYILYDYDLIDKNFKLLDTCNGTQIFENPDAFPLIFETRELYHGKETDNDFEFQNGLFRTFDKNHEIDADIFEKVNCKMKVKQSDNDCIVKIRISDPNPDIFYMQLPEMKKMDKEKRRSKLVNCHGEKEIEYTSAKDVYTLGRPDENGKIALNLGVDQKSDKDNIVVYRQKEDVLSSYVRQIKEKQSVDVREISSSHLVFESDKKEDVLYTSTIPFDKGWHVKVDGKRADISVNADCFLSFPVAAGKHKVELTYHTKGLTAGIIISVISLLILLGTEYIERTSKRAIRRGKKWKKNQKRKMQ